MKDQPHGTPYGYAEHVRRRTPKCDPCRRAHAARQRNYEIRRYLNRGPLAIDSTGTRRRLEALHAIGWDAGALGARLGVSKPAVRQWRTRPHVYLATAQRVTALYGELADTAGPNERTSRHAERVGWAPPIAWDDDTIDDPATKPYAEAADSQVDEVAVHRAMRGDTRVQLNRPERLEAVRLLTDLGLSSAEIAARLDKHQRAVIRDRATVAARAAG